MPEGIENSGVEKTVFEDRLGDGSIGEFRGDVKGVELPERVGGLAIGRDKTAFCDDGEASRYI